MSARGPLDFDDDPRERGVGGGEPPPEPPPPARPPGASRYTWFIGLAGFLLLVVVTLNTFVTDSPVESGGPDSGDKLLPFAVPLAASDLDGDANLATKAGQGDAGARPACEVRGPDILNICEEWEQGPVVLAIFPASAGRCREILQQFRRFGPQHRDVRFVAVGSRGDRDDLRGAWGFPVGWDRDGQVLARYGVVGCPQVFFSKQGGAITDTVYKPIDDRAFAAQLKALR
ncbi:MAG TPA: hypothetical protein VF587_00460 [Solirubrobacteraceae bacterium]|jgi:hypothetical protein